MKDLHFEEIFNEPIESFTSHLTDEANERILFSGKFGSGKTTFLRQYFEEDESRPASKEYNVFHLFPVNYSIASNEDIIRYIKYDLILQLLEKAQDMKEINLGFMNLIPKFLLKKVDTVAATLVGMVPKVGKDVVSTWENIMALVKEFQKYQSDVNNGEGDKLVEYIDNMHAELGSIYENDVITKIISSNVNIGGKQSVLIIDDLDRVDPEHLLRIMNVFAAHFDSRSLFNPPNKFGFKKVILVCDVKNLKNIFHHKYGDNVDYLGYTDKFYSSHIYHFDNRKSVKSIVQEVLNTIELMPADPSGMKNGELETLRKIYFGGKWIEEMLIYFLEHEIISLRTLLKIHSLKTRVHYEEINLSNDTRFGSSYAWRIPMIVQIKLLSMFFGDKDSFIKCLQLQIDRNLPIKDYEYFAPHLAYIASTEHISRRNEEFLTEIRGKQLVLLVEYRNDIITGVGTFEYKGNNANNKPVKGDYYQPTLNNYWTWLFDSANKLSIGGYLK